MKHIKIAVAAVLLLFVGVVYTADTAEGAWIMEDKMIVTDNGAKLKCRTYGGEEYTVIDIITEKEDIIIPETVDGEHRITALCLMESSGNHYYKKVKHIHLSRYIEEIYEDWTGCEMLEKYNIFHSVPNLSLLTVDSANPNFYAMDGKVYNKATWDLLAIVPNLSGEVVIEKYVRSIAANATLELRKVTGFSVEKGNTNFQSKEGVLYDKSGKTLLAYPIAKRGKSFKIPSGVAEISAQAFQAAKYIRKVTLPSSLRKIGYFAFSNTKLKSIKLNKKLREMGYYVFYGTKIKIVKLPSGLRHAEIGSLAGKRLTIPENLGEIEVVRDPDSMIGYLNSSVLVVKNPALDLLQIENLKEGAGSIFEGKTVYAYKGSLPYKQMKRLAKKERVKVKVRALKGKVFRTPQNTGKVDTSWYSENADTYYISTPAQLAGLSKISRTKAESFYEKRIVLTRNLNMKDYKNFIPISYFRGDFDGQGHTIRNLNIYRLQENVALFSRVMDGTISNIKVYGTVTGGNCTGGIVGTSCGDNVLKNCSFTGKVKGYGYCGKLIGDGYRLV